MTHESDYVKQTEKAILIVETADASVNIRIGNIDIGTTVRMDLDYRDVETLTARLNEWLTVHALDNVIDEVEKGCPECTKEGRE